PLRARAWRRAGVLVFCTFAAAATAAPTNPDMSDPRHKEIIPEQYRPAGLPDSLAPAAAERVRGFIAAARAAKLGLSDEARKISPLLREPVTGDETGPGARMLRPSAGPQNPLLSRDPDGAIRLEVHTVPGAAKGLVVEG